MTNKIRSMDWDRIQNIATSLVENNYFKDIEYVLAIAEGGIQFAHMIAAGLGVPRFNVVYSSKMGNGGGKKRPYFPTFRYRNILLVDDIIDTGHTIKDVHDHYSLKGNKITTCVLYFNDDNEARVGHDRCGQIYYSEELNKNYKPWIVFPWEDEWDYTK